MRPMNWAKKVKKFLVLAYTPAIRYKSFKNKKSEKWS